MEQVRPTPQEKKQASGRVCIRRDAHSKEAVCLPCPHTAADALSCHLTFLSHCGPGYVMELLQDTGSIAWANWWRMEQWEELPATDYRHRSSILACCCCYGSQCHWSYIPTLDLSQEAKKQWSHTSHQDAYCLTSEPTTPWTDMCLDNFCNGCKDISWNWRFSCCNLVWNNLLLKWVWKIKLEKLCEGTATFEAVTVVANN